MGFLRKHQSHRRILRRLEEPEGTTAPQGWCCRDDLQGAPGGSAQSARWGARSMPPGLMVGYQDGVFACDYENHMRYL